MHSDGGDDLSVLADEGAALSGIAPREFISVADDAGNSVTVSVLGRNAKWAAGLDAEIVVGTPFVSSRRRQPREHRPGSPGGSAANRSHPDRRVNDEGVVLPVQQQPATTARRLAVLGHVL
ncbi:DUF5959 family protein [Streptomyces sp. NPDC005706]|uniref:DUF5959 family protein n=1 Tax=Streptomyces sp. NPDC005706 TaxID=3157169 RepID=UPI0033DB3491